MRDPKRIKPFLNKLQKEWEKFPDLRFGQLVENISRQTTVPQFVIEDCDFEKLIDMWAENTKGLE